MTSVEELNVLLIDDSRDDALLITEALIADGLDVTTSRVDDAAALRNALATQSWDVVICDYSMPFLTTAEALCIVKEVDDDIPFIVVSGVIGEDAAVEMMRAGAVDYVMKDRLARLVPAIRREMRDVKERKSHDAARWKAEELVLRQKQDLEDAQRIAHLGSWYRDLPGGALQWSDELCRIFGRSPDTNPTEEALLNAIEAADREKVVTAIAQAHEKGTPIDVVYRIVRPDGKQRTVHSFGEVTRDADGAPQQLRGVTQDVTDRLAAAQVHESLNRHVQLLLESTTQGIFGLDTKGRCTFINRAASESLGYSAAQLVGLAMHDVIHPKHDLASYAPDGCPIQIAASTGTAIEVQSDSLSCRDGSMLPVEYSVAPIIDGGVVAGAVVVFTDVSERKLLQAQLQQSDRVSSLGRLAATMAHEFNNVLMGIQPFAELLARQNGGESSQRATQNILKAVQRGRSITHGILRFAKPAEPVKETIDVAAWLRSMETAMIAVLGDHIGLNLRIDGEALFVRGDRHQLEQVLTNLASNARDAMPGGGSFSVLLERCLSGRVFPFGAIRTSDQYLHLHISDTGCGMDAKTLKSIFDPFFTMKRSGTGLGLAVVHQVMQAHGGNIIAESIPGEGTTFHLFLPFCEEAFEEMATLPTLLSDGRWVDPHDRRRRDDIQRRRLSASR